MTTYKSNFRKTQEQKQISFNSFIPCQEPSWRSFIHFYEKVLFISSSLSFQLLTPSSSSSLSSLLKVLYHWLVQASLLIVKIQTDLDDQVNYVITGALYVTICTPTGPHFSFLFN